ncbi:MAG: ATPase [Saprospiraceae bacterium]|nr:ATPase [Saprospiraceae bacterium]MDW8484597.1 ATPase [Saprospiraceae bacterium]
MNRPVTFLCIASYFKGNDFLRGMKSTGATVYLLTSKKLEHKPWAREALDDIFYVQQGPENQWNMEDVIKGLAWLMRTRKVDRIVALDDFDVEKGAHLREEFRIPGMGQTTCRHFRDKLAMRMKAQEAGIPIPGFCALFNDDDIRHFTAHYPGPWLVKPRGQASATGMKKIYHTDELWAHLETLGDERHTFLVEQFKPGTVYHVDALVSRNKIVFVRASEYLAPPFEVAHGGGIFRSVILDQHTPHAEALLKLNAEVLQSFGMKYSACHTEFIKCHQDGQFYFLETASRVGGAHIADMIEQATGINLWREWARLEYAEATGQKYELPPVRDEYAGLIVSLTRQEWPDTSSFNDPEVVWRLTDMSYHIGLIVRSPERARILELLDDYARRIQQDYHASAPAPPKPLV